MTMSSIYIAIDSNSDRNKDFFPDNDSSKFKVHLKKPLHLVGVWKMARMEIHIQGDNKTKYNDHLYLFCDLSGETFIDGEPRQNILRKIRNIKKGNWSQTYHLPYYMDVTKTDISDIEFYITDEDFKKPSFLKKSVSLTVHLRRYPFLTL